MAIIKKMRKQRAVYWPPGPKGEFGELTYFDPIEVRCRWQDKQGEFLDHNGQMLTADATVFVDRDLEVNGALWLAPDARSDAVAQLPENTTGPSRTIQAQQIRSFSKLPNLKVTDYLRTCMTTYL